MLSATSTAKQIFMDFPTRAEPLRRGWLKSQILKKMQAKSQDKSKFRQRAKKSGARNGLLRKSANETTL